VGEFVGINPAKARSLLLGMRDLNDRVAVLRTELGRKITEAGAELAPGGERGPDVFARYLRFLHEESRDLEWRIRVITSGGTPGPGGLVVGQVGFDTPAQARSQGQADGRSISDDFHNEVVLGPSRWDDRRRRVRPGVRGRVPPGPGRHAARPDGKHPRLRRGPLRHRP